MVLQKVKCISILELCSADAWWAANGDELLRINSGKWKIHMKNDFKKGTTDKLLLQ